MGSEMKFNVPASAIGLDEVTLAAERTSSFIDCADVSSVTILYEATRDAYTDLQFALDWYRTDGGSAPVAFESLGGDPGVSGSDMVTALYPDKYLRTVSASENKSFNVPAKARFLKIRVDATSGGAGDSIKVNLVLIKTS